METKKKYEIYNKKYNECVVYESYDYCAGTFLAWNLIMKGWKIKDCIIKEIEEDE